MKKILFASLLATALLFTACASSGTPSSSSSESPLPGVELKTMGSPIFGHVSIPKDWVGPLEDTETQEHIMTYSTADESAFVVFEQSDENMLDIGVYTKSLNDSLQKMPEYENVTVSLDGLPAMRFSFFDEAQNAHVYYWVFKKDAMMVSLLGAFPTENHSAYAALMETSYSVSEPVSAA